MPTPAPTTVSDRIGVDRWEFAASPPLSTYITALIAGPYYRVTDVHQGRGGEIPLGLFCRRLAGRAPRRRRALRRHQAGLRLLRRGLRLPYPFGKYDQLFVPEFNAGAMENAGAVTFLEDYVFRSKVTDAAYERRAVTVLHEMAHMWFGDLVTMRWWDDLWLNESFAEYMSARSPGRARHPLRHGVDDLRQRREDVGLPAGPAALDAPDRRRHRRPRGRRGRTSTASPTPRARRCSSSSSPGSARTSSSPAAATTSNGTPGATRRCSTCSASSRRPAAATCRPGRRSGWRPPASTRCGPRSRPVRTARSRRSPSCRRRPSRAPDAALAPHRDRPLRPRRRPAGTPGPGRARRRRGDDRRAGAGRRAPAGPGAAQRRRPDLRRRSGSTTRSLATVTEHISELPHPLPRALCWAAPGT